MAKKAQPREAPPAAPVVSQTDLDALSAAYKSSLILGWKLDATRGFRLTLADGRDEYVEAAKLAAYLDKLRGAGS